MKNVTMKVQKSVDIAAPPEKIWPYLVEPEKVLAWFTTLQSFEYTSEKHNGVGTRFSWEEKAHGSPIRLRFTITEWVENERLAFSNISGDTVNSYGLGWAVTATAQGSRFTFDEEWRCPLGSSARSSGGLPVAARSMI